MIVVTTSEAIREIVGENILYSMLINSGLANYTGLARKIQNQVESMTGTQVKVNTIVKALSNISTENKDQKALEILKNSNLTAEYRYSEENVSSLEGLEDRLLLAVREGDSYRCILKSGKSSDLALIRILLPEAASGEPGITLLVVEYLNLFGLDIRNIYRLDTEIWLTVRMAEAGKVLDKLGRFLYVSQK